MARRRRTRRKTDNTTVGAIVLVVLVLGACGFLFDHLTGNRDIALAPRMPPFPTATFTPDPRYVQGAVLGGPDSAFPTTFQQFDAEDFSGTIAGHPVTLVIRPTGTDGRVTRIIVYANGTDSWNQATAAAIAKAFLPPDSVHLRDTLSEFGDGYMEHVYRSAKLAASLDPSSFVDELDLTTENTPGTFKWSCAPYPSNHPGFGMCTISTEAPKL